MWIEGGSVYDVELGFKRADIYIENGRIIYVGDKSDFLGGEGAVIAQAQSDLPCDSLTGSETIDVTGLFVAPGFVDLHFHGAMGADMCDATLEALHTIARYEASRGVTSICPATMTLPQDRLLDIMSTAADFAAQAEESDLQGEFADCAELVGINMEGPYISPSKVGAQNPSFVRRASVDEFATLQEVSDGLIAICDIAPEEPGALDFIEYLTASGVRASVAHTTADYTAAMSAFEAGVCQLTHTFNAMPGLHHRTPGPIAAAADCDWVRPELIADGIHIHPSMIRLAFKLFGAERMLLVSDTMRACGLDDGVYDLGGQDVTVAGKVATVNDGALAGSVSDLATCVEYAVSRAGIDLADAIRAASYNPACALGLNGYAGELVPGAKADIVILDSEAHLRQSILRGRVM